jgi:hypothetical protein
MRGPDGKVPLFNDSGMVMRLTPTQLFMRAVGLNPADVKAEQQMMSYLHRNRDEIRGMRGRYTRAVVEGNHGEAQRVQDEFERRYPGMGGIRVKEADLKAAKERMFMTRLQRMMRTMPVQYRDQFGDVLGAAFSSNLGNRMGVSMPAPTAAWSGGAGSFGPAFGGASMPLFGPVSEFGL